MSLTSLELFAKQLATVEPLADEYESPQETLRHFCLHNEDNVQFYSVVACLFYRNPTVEDIHTLIENNGQLELDRLNLETLPPELVNQVTVISLEGTTPKLENLCAEALAYVHSSDPAIKHAKQVALRWIDGKLWKAALPNVYTFIANKPLKT